MLFLLPPSETKRSGGLPDTSLDLGALSFPGLDRTRRSVLAALARLSRDHAESARLLKLSPALAEVEVARNRVLRTSPVLPALQRYTGVVYDPIRADALDPDEWRWAAEHVGIHSALFGLLRAGDPVPAYRLSHDTRLPDRPLRATWSRPAARELAALGRPVVDLRSEGYAELGPAPADSLYVRVVSDADGRRRALNHFNKKTKGTLIARLIASRPALSTLGDFIDWCGASGIVVERVDGELVVVSESVLEGVPVSGTP